MAAGGEEGGGEGGGEGGEEGGGEGGGAEDDHAVHTAEEDRRSYRDRRGDLADGLEFLGRRGPPSSSFSAG